MIATLRSEDFVDGATPELLHKLFAEDDIRVFGSRSLRFNCRCSQSKVEEALRILGETESLAVLAEKGRIDVRCEYCGRLRSFDNVDVSRLFAGSTLAGSDAIH